MEFEQYFNLGTREVPLLRWLYILCFPLAKLFAWLRLSPFAITTLSNIMIIASLYFLLSDLPWLFALGWLSGLILDICDGMVARINNLSSANGSFYDHFSDQIKIVLICIVLFVKYDGLYIQIVSVLIGVLFLLLGNVNQTIAHRSFRLSSSPRERKESDNNQDQEESRVTFVRGVYASLFLMYGNTMLYFIPVGFGEITASVFTTFFLIILVKSIFMSVYRLIKLNSEFTIHGVKWK